MNNNACETSSCNISSAGSGSSKIKKIKINPSIVSKLIQDLNNNNNIWENTSDTCDTCDNPTLEEKNIELQTPMTPMTPKTPMTPSTDDKTGYYYRHREQKIEYQKKYNREQGDKIKNYNKDYYQKRREEILEKAKTKIICECGCEVQLFNMNSHKKTKKHAKALENVRALERAIEMA